jgi:hypothetical protein
VVICSTYHVVSVPAIMGVSGALAIVPWIFMQAIVSRQRAHMFDMEVIVRRQD